MKTNTKVKVKTENPGGVIWRAGTILDVQAQESGQMRYLVGVGERHYFNYEERWFLHHNVKEYVELPEGAAETIHAEQLQLALALTQEAIAALIPGTEVKVVDGSLSCCGLTMDPVVYDHETIGQFREAAAWQVNFWKHYSATRTEPEDCVDCPIEGPLHWNLAVQLFVRSIFIAKADAYWDAKADEAMAKQFEEEAAMVF
jgi:hypothetical protein